jgi:hypothetical protein
MAYSFVQDGPIAGGRITIWRPPRKDKPVALGLDFALGLQDGDFDAGVALDVDHKLVFTCHGRWAESFSDILWPLLQWYEPFVVGERQVGLPILRNLYDRGYGWLYFNREESKKGRPPRDMLGHARYAGDTIIPRLRRLIAPRASDGTLEPSKIEIYDAELHGQLCKFGFQPRSDAVPDDGTGRDAQYKMSAPAGEHDDLVLACAYACAGVEWLPAYEKPPARFAPGTVGHMLGMDEPDESTPKRSRWAK